MSGLRNAKLLQTIRVMVDSLNTSVSTHLNRAVDAVNTLALRYVSGARNAKPWTFPVPRRSGGLRLNQKAQRTTPASPFTAYVFNLAPYAAAVHSGVVNEWAGRGKTRTTQVIARPFLEKAVDEVDPLYVVQSGITREWLTQWA